jgi:hypothetical protein
MCVSQAHELGRHRGCTSESGVLMNTEALSFIDHVATNSTGTNNHHIYCLLAAHRWEVWACIGKECLCAGLGAKLYRAEAVRLCGHMWGSDVVEVLGGSWGSLRCTQIHTLLIVNQAYACATTDSTEALGQTTLWT